MANRLTYEQQLLQPEWKAKRLEILRRDNFTCSECGITADESLLHVHHRYYLPDHLAWQYDDIVLITLCEEHHFKEEIKIKLYSAQLIETLKQYGATSEELMEMIFIFGFIKNIETIIQVSHEYMEREMGLRRKRKLITKRHKLLQFS